MRTLLLAAIAATLFATAPAEAQHYGYVDFPKDENTHNTGFDYWWGAAHLVTTDGNRYTVAVATTSFSGYAASGEQVFAHAGPYKGLSLLSEQGPAEWGHPEAPPGRYLTTTSRYLPGVSERLALRTMDTTKGPKTISSWKRSTLDAERYHLHIDDDEAEVHPTGMRIKLGVDLDADMKGPPLLDGGTGQWWYGIPDYYHYPSRSFQYMQAARKLTGTIEIQQPDGTIRRETVDPARSQLEMVHEYDATPEDLFAGFVLAESTQLHPRYPQYYNGGMPWELFYIDFDNGAQMMLAVMAFHDTPNGTLTQVLGKDQPTYKVLSTLRLPDGRSVNLDDAVRVEHLDYRRIVGQTPGPFIQVKGVWTQGWKFRASFGGGRVKAGDGTMADVPPFDLGLTPQLEKGEPKLGDDGKGLTQRVPFDAAGSYGGCPIHGFGFSELIINWTDREKRDPWWTGGDLPKVPASCGDAVPTPPTGQPGNLNPPPEPSPPPGGAPESCWVDNPPDDSCTYVATSMGGVSGYGAEPGGWRVTVERPGLKDPIVFTSFGGYEMYACGSVKPGDTVTVDVKPGSHGFAGNPGICF